MATLSISRAWDETKDILARDGKLFMAIAAALILLPQVVVALFTGPGQPGGPLTAAVVVISIIVTLIGQLAIVRLALTSGLSVGEAIRHGLSRAAPFLLAVVLMLIAILIICFVAIAILALAGAIRVDPTVAQPSPRDIAIIAAVLIVPLIYLAVRLMLLVAVASSEPIGPVAMLKRSWNLTRGHVGRLLGFILVFMIAALIVLAAVGIVIGLVIGLLFGEPTPLSLSALLIALLSGIAQAAVTVVYVVMIARIYSQRAGEVTVPSSGT